MRGKLWLMIGVLVVLAGVERYQLGNPDPAPADAPADQFSATRAIAALHDVSLDAPHALATPAHDVVRDRVAAALRALHYEVAIEHRFACNAYAQCGAVDNVIARVPGANGAAVVIAAHYDSVPAGPGASDDGTGVATALELARILRSATPRNPIEFFIDDGEEAGLLGAEALVADPARAGDVGFVINLEARGTSGTPFLFETSREQRWLVPIVAGALPHPMTSSLFATIYDLLPNDTDLTVFKRAGRPGINFAYLGDATQYHTPLDDFAHVDAGAVQRRGDQALAMARAFADVALGDASDGDSREVWFDVFAAFVVRWPAGASLAITIVALVMLGAAIVRGRKRAHAGASDGALTLPGVALGVASFVVTAVVAVLAGLVIGKLMAIRGPGAQFEPYPAPMLAAAALAGLGVALGVATLARRWASFDAVFAGHALGWNLLGLLLVAMLPGAAYMAVVPGAAMAIGALARPRLGEAGACGLALVAVSTVVLPFALIGHDALGAQIVPAECVMLALIATTFAPLGGGWPALGAIALAVIAAGIAMVVPRASDSHPYHLSLAHVTDADRGEARWQYDGATPLVRAAVQERRDQPTAPWFGAGGTYDIAPAPHLALAAPTAQVTAGAPAADGTRTITLDVASQRQAPRLAVIWQSAAEVVAVRVNGTPLPPRPARFQLRLAAGWSWVLVRGASAHLEITVRGTAPARARIADTTFGLPAVGAPLAALRDASGAVPVQDGDVTTVERFITW